MDEASGTRCKAGANGCGHVRLLEGRRRRAVIIMLTRQRNVSGLQCACRQRNARTRMTEARPRLYPPGSPLRLASLAFPRAARALLYDVRAPHARGAVRSPPAVVFA